MTATGVPDRAAVAKDRVISTVDPEARHGHKTAARGFDGYKGHIAIDPDSEMITGTQVSAGNLGDAAVAADLVGDVGGEPAPDAAVDGDGQDAEQGQHQGPIVYGDAAYGSSGEFLEHLAVAGIESRCKTQPPTAAGGMLTKDRFGINLEAGMGDLPGRRHCHDPPRQARDAPPASPLRP